MKQPFFRFLDTVGDGSGTKSAIGNYAGGVQKFRLNPGVGEILHLTRLIVTVTDAGPLDADAYGKAIVLTNGIQIYKYEGSDKVINLTDNVPVKTNGHWASFCYDVSALEFGTGSDVLQVRWSFDKTGTLIQLADVQSEYFSVELHDDFSGLVDHTFQVQGYKQRSQR